MKLYLIVWSHKYGQDYKLFSTKSEAEHYQAELEHSIAFDIENDYTELEELNLTK